MAKQNTNNSDNLFEIKCSTCDKLILSVERYIVENRHYHLSCFNKPIGDSVE